MRACAIVEVQARPILSRLFVPGLAPGIHGNRQGRRRPGMAGSKTATNEQVNRLSKSENQKRGRVRMNGTKAIGTNVTLIVTLRNRINLRLTWIYLVSSAVSPLRMAIEEVSR
jgi:hypothetical protein